MKAGQRDSKAIACDIDNDRSLILISLTHENGFNNIIETLNQISEKISLAGEEIFDYKLNTGGRSNEIK